MDITKAIEYGQLVSLVSNIPPNDLDNRGGTRVKCAGKSFDVLSSIYANDLATMMSPEGDKSIVSIGLVVKEPSSNVVILALRGTERIREWVYDGEFEQVDFPYLKGVGRTEDGFTTMFESLSLSSTNAAPPLRLPQPFETNYVICGHSLGGALATLLAVDFAIHEVGTDVQVYTYGSPRVGDHLFSQTYARLIPNTYRIANRLDLVPNLPLPPAYEHVCDAFSLNSIQLLPPKILLAQDLWCQHYINSYLYLLSLKSGGEVIALDDSCKP